MEQTNKPTAANAVPQTDSTRKPLERTYEAAVPYTSDCVRQFYQTANRLARSTEVGFTGPEPFIIGILSSESPIIRAVRNEFMISPADLWPSLYELLPKERYLTLCNRAPLTPRCKEIFYAAFQTAHDANRKARVADFLVHFFDYANGSAPPDAYVLGLLADFDFTQAPVVSFIRSREHLEPPMPPDPPAPSAPRLERRVWKSATDRYADWRIRPAAKHEDRPASQK